MRLLYVSRSSGGHDRRFANAWRAAGFDVSEFATETNHSLNSQTQAQLNERIEKFQPDLVQVGPVTHPGWDVAQLWAGPLIATSWGFDLLQDIEGDTVLRGKAQEALERADLLFVDNDASASRARGLGVDTRQIAQFPWGVDNKWFAPRSFLPLSDALQVKLLCTRRHEAIYRVDDILTSFLEAAERRDNIQLTLVGSGTLTPELKARAASSPAGERVEFLGDIDNGSLPSIYRNADVYLSASEVDGTSVSLLEAMASGAIVVVSANEGNAQWVTEQTGFSFAIGDTDSLTRLIHSLAGLNPAVVADARARAFNATGSVQALADWDLSVRRFPEFARAAMGHWR